ncbi:hypothetical protein GJ699_31605 [Duganella sp. FT80W]|uniref:DUF4258 domain-containing protein n=1 Tax=Duganella guangzhouensis TaxID=2666084 RepID=A0A6I2LCI2_9BURK|nr:hypothetical protein [Duganella guangzhouensis]MRW94524.1 hypothetical protein [Duganella guangzhouensis]
MIYISKRGWQHILKHHTGTQMQGSRKKSTFNANEDLVQLINLASQHPPLGKIRNHLVRVFDAGHPVGINRRTGQPTTLVTVLTRLNGELVTMFPGTP